MRQRLGPDLHSAFRTLFREHRLPVTEPQRHQIAVVGEVEELFARGLVCLSGQERQLIVSVQMHFVGPAADRVTG